MHGLQATDSNFTNLDAMIKETIKMHVCYIAPSSLFCLVSQAKTYLDILKISAGIAIHYYKINFSNVT